MGMFTQRRDEENTWAALPAEPRDTDASDTLPVSDADPFAIGTGLDAASAEWIALPVPAPADGAGGEPENPA